MAQITASALVVLASISAAVKKGLFSDMYCLFFFGEPDFKEIESDISNN